MGFEPDQQPSRLESVNEFKDRMRSALEEAKATLVKSKDDMVRYYNQKRTAAPTYKPGDKVYLDAGDIQTTCPSKKLSHKRLGPFSIERQVGNGAYRLCLSPSMSRLHPVFNVVKLTPAVDDPIQGRQIPPPPPPEIVDSEEEWDVEEILDSKVINRKLRYLIKWKDYGIEHNSWEPWDTPDLLADFYQKHPGAARHIRSIEFQSIPFRSIEVPRRHFLKGGVDVRGLPFPTTDPVRVRVRVHAQARKPTYPVYVPPHKRPNWICPWLDLSTS
jgi:Chromo (CHRromatin Organisation MOdifier) domain